MKKKTAKLRLLDFDRPGCRIRIQFKQPYLLILAVGAIAWYIIDPNRVSVVATTGLVGILLIAYLWARQMALYTHSGRELLYAAYQVGDELEESIWFKNDSLLPVIWVEFSDRSNLPGYTVSAVRAAGSNSMNKWSARTICTRRGVYKLGPWEMMIGEPFGLFQVSHQYEKSVEILVYPPLAEKLPDFNLRRGSLGDLRTMNHAVYSETIQAYTTRAYQPGDALRRVHWPTSAKKGDLFVKSFDPETTQSVWLLPDLDAGVQAGSGDENTVEFIAMLTATLVADLLKQKMSVGLAVMQEDMLILPPAQGSQTLWNLLKAIAPLEVCPDCALNDTLTKLSVSPLKNGKLVVITPSADPGWLGALYQLNRGFGRNALEVILIDASTFDESREEQKAGTLTIQKELQNHGVGVHILGRGDIQPRLAAYGQLNRWEFISYGTGRIRVEKKPMPLAMSQNRS